MVVALLGGAEGDGEAEDGALAPKSLLALAEEPEFNEEVHICMYVYIHIYKYRNTYTHTHTHTHTHTP